MLLLHSYEIVSSHFYFYILFYLFFDTDSFAASKKYLEFLLKLLCFCQGIDKLGWRCQGHQTQGCLWCLSDHAVHITTA